MKIRLLLGTITFTLGSLFGSQVHAMTLNFHGKQAKHLYHTLSGPTVTHEGAAGHLYRKGKSILCRYTDVDITKHGKSVQAAK